MAKANAKTKTKAKTKVKAKTKSKTNAAATVRAKVLEIFREVYPVKESDAAILKIDPNGYDMDPAPFYEMLESEFGPDILDEENESFSGLGGTVAQTIDAIASRWDGKASKGDETVGLSEGPYPMLDFYLGNIALNTKQPTASDLKKELNMFKHEQRSDYKALKAEAEQAIAQRHTEQIVEIAHRNKLKMDAAQVDTALQQIVEH